MSSDGKSKAISKLSLWKRFKSFVAYLWKQGGEHNFLSGLIIAIALLIASIFPNRVGTIFTNQFTALIPQINEPVKLIIGAVGIVLSLSLFFADSEKVALLRRLVIFPLGNTGFGAAWSLLGIFTALSGALLIAELLHLINGTNYLATFRLPMSVLLISFFVTILFVLVSGTVVALAKGFFDINLPPENATEQQENEHVSRIKERKFMELILSFATAIVSVKMICEALI